MIEEIIGISKYYYRHRGIGGIIKTNLKDFIVVERYSDELEKEGNFAVYFLKKKGRNTIEVIEEIAEKLGIDVREIGFAGIKDKSSISFQRISFPAKYKEKVDNLSIKKAKLFFLGFRREKIRKGCLLGNLFVVTIRHSKGDIEEWLEKAEKYGGLERGRSPLPLFINYFGPQRFGNLRPIMHIVGKCLVKNKVEEGIKFFLGLSFPLEPEKTREARDYFFRYEDTSHSLKIFPKELHYERKILEYLSKKGKKYKDSLKVLPKNLQRLFVDAYQSYLFNRFASKLMGRRKYACLPGYKIKDLSEEEKEVLEEEGISLSDFRMPHLPYLKAKGTYRKILERVEDLSVLSKDPVRIRFFLKKGCYATSFLREVMKKDAFLLEFKASKADYSTAGLERKVREFRKILTEL
ncbi:MAG: tRNA pseudouridine(13) synthase TruD [Candidatus Altiarchaeales archaeon]|nr:MAG: tRNA pseudouridine(13) synthase TruD [Candidatus Altiarchaeales archaeon]